MAKKTDDKDKKDPESHEDFLLLFRRGLKFTEELLAENEKLRFRIASLESETDTLKRQSTKSGEAVVQELRAKVQELETEKQRLLSSYREVETLNRDYQVRYAEIEEEHNNLANLYIASYQLHSTMEFREVVQVIHEIVINLVGVAQFTMYLHDAPNKRLCAIAGEGVDLAAQKPIPLGEGIVGKATAERRRHVGTPVHQKGATDGPMAVVPLCTVEQIVGCIVIDTLLVQKETLTAVDNELFNLLSVHAATALLSGLLRDTVGERAGADALSLAHAKKLL